MEREKLEYILEYFQTEIRQKIKDNNYSEAEQNLFGLLAELQVEQITRRLTSNLIAYLPNAIASTRLLINAIKENNTDNINSEIETLEMNLKQYKMRIETIAE